VQTGCAAAESHLTRKRWRQRAILEVRHPVIAMASPPRNKVLSAGLVIVGTGLLPTAICTGAEVASDVPSLTVRRAVNAPSAE
jgi:hypothetical protein